jgi:hypothetical protein
MSQATLRDLTAEAVAIEGTGAATFLGAMRGHRTFAAAYAGVLPITGVNLKIEHGNAQGYIIAWENSTCTVTATGFTRVTCISSSNNNNFVDFGTDGYKRAFVFIPVADLGGGATEAVLYTAQTLTAPQQTQACENIGAASASTVDDQQAALNTFGDDLLAQTTALADLDASLAAVAKSGEYNDLIGGPTLGTSAALDVAASGDAAAGQVVKGDDSRLVGPSIVTTLRASGNIAKPLGARFAEIELWGGGGPGASGRKGAAGTNRCGGGGGSPGVYVRWRVDASECDANLVCTIPAAGAGGAAISANSTSGNTGATVADATVLLKAGGMLLSAQSGAPGIGGNASNGPGGAVRSAAAAPFISAGATTGGSATTGGGGVGGSSTFGNCGGGAGGSIDTVNGVAPGGAGGAITVSSSGMANAVAGGFGGAIATNGSQAIMPSGAWHGAPGGGGGGSSLVGNAGDGAAGVGYGGAGGGGGAAVNDVGNSGKGGDGAAGAVRVTWVF